MTNVPMVIDERVPKMRLKSGQYSKGAFKLDNPNFIQEEK